jgi:hypothetical protein
MVDGFRNGQLTIIWHQPPLLWAMMVMEHGYADYLLHTCTHPDISRLSALLMSNHSR